MDSGERFTRWLIILLLLALIGRFIWDGREQTHDSWEYTTTNVDTLRHLSKTCGKIFNGNYAHSGDKEKGWHIKCRYQRGNDAN